MTSQTHPKTPPRFGSRSGQAISEYMILIALISVGSIAVLQVLSSNLQSRLGIVSEALRGEKKKLSGQALTKEHYSIRDLGNFQDAMQNSGD